MLVSLFIFYCNLIAYQTTLQGLTDYPKIITHPMDLGTIKNRLRASNKKKDAPSSRHYTNLLQVSKDVHQVWTNCTLYNAE